MHFPVPGKADFEKQDLCSLQTKHSKAKPNHNKHPRRLPARLESSVKSQLHLFKRPLGHLPVGFFYNCCLSSTNVIGTSEMMADDKLDKHALKKGTTDLTTGWKAPYKHIV